MISILDLPEKVKSLNRKKRNRFQDIFNIDVQQSKLVLPSELRGKVASWFRMPGDTSNEDAISRVESQVVVTITNRLTLESTVFNSLRAMKPVAAYDRAADKDMAVWIDKNRVEGKCDFCRPEELTSSEEWGRVQGRHCCTAANVAQGAPRHALLVFKKHHPLEFGLEEVQDFLETYSTWIMRTQDHMREMSAVSSDPAAAFIPPQYATLLWNCMPKAGASQPHGHAQMVMSHSPLNKTNILIRAATEYNTPQKTVNAELRDYITDWVECHKDVRLSRHIQDDVHVIATLTPLKEREIFVIGPPGMSVASEAMARGLSVALRTLVDKCNTRAFNAAVYAPTDKTPAIARVVDRGALAGPSDVASFELFGTPLVAADPYQVIAKVDELLDAQNKQGSCLVS